jgi:hypothetical protein
MFNMDGVDVVNKCISPKPLTFNMPDGHKVKSTHICDITILGLPVILTGHIVPHLAIASLIGIQPLCNAGCKVMFDKDKCDIMYEGNLILCRYKDKSMDLWTLPINGTNEWTALPQLLPVVDHAPQAGVTTLPKPHPGITLAAFMHLVQTHANRVKFSHQLLCNPKILRLLKAACKGFLKGCPTSVRN